MRTFVLNCAQYCNSTIYKIIFYRSCCIPNLPQKIDLIISPSSYFFMFTIDSKGHICTKLCTISNLPQRTDQIITPILQKKL